MNAETVAKAFNEWMASALGGLGAAAGPLGAIIGGALVLAVGNYTLKDMEAKQSSDQLRAEMECLGLVAPQTAEGIDQAGIRKGNRRGILNH